MAYAIKKPSILSTLLSQLSNFNETLLVDDEHFLSETCPFHVKISKSEFVQIFNLKPSSYQGFLKSNCSIRDDGNVITVNELNDDTSSFMVSTISDRKNSLRAHFTSECMNHFKNSKIHQISLVDLEGSVLLLQDFTLEFDKVIMEFIATISMFHYIGASGSAIFNNPQAIHECHQIREFLLKWRRLHSSNRSSVKISKIHDTTNSSNDNDIPLLLLLTQEQSDHQEYHQQTSLIHSTKNTCSSKLIVREEEVVVVVSKEDIIHQMNSNQINSSSSSTSPSYVSWHLEEEITLQDCLISIDQQRSLDSYENWPHPIPSITFSSHMSDDDTRSLGIHPNSRITTIQAHLFREIYGEPQPLEFDDETNNDSILKETSSSVTSSSVTTPSVTTPSVTTPSVTTPCKSILSKSSTNSSLEIQPTTIMISVEKKIPDVQSIIADNSPSSQSNKKYPITFEATTTTPLLFSHHRIKETCPSTNSKAALTTVVSPWGHLLSGISEDISSYDLTEKGGEHTMDQIHLNSTTRSKLNFVSPDDSHGSLHMLSSPPSLSRKRASPNSFDSESSNCCEYLVATSSSTGVPHLPKPRSRFHWLPEYYQKKYQDSSSQLSEKTCYFKNVRSW